MKHKCTIFRAILLLAIISFPAMIVTSCHEDEPEPEGPRYGKRMKSILMIDCNQVQGSTTNRDYYVRLEYDEQNRLIKLTEEHKEPAVTTLTYMPGEVTLELDGRSLGKYTLNDKGLAVAFDRGDKYQYTYEYNSAGYLIKSGNGEYESTYEYEKENMVSWVYRNSSGTYTPSETEDKLNAPAYYQFLYLHILGNIEVVPAYMAGLFGNSSKYLPDGGKLIYTDGENQEILDEVITYEFTKDGYVSHMVQKIDGVKSGDMYIDYEDYVIE